MLFMWLGLLIMKKRPICESIGLLMMLVCIDRFIGQQLGKLFIKVNHSAVWFIPS